MEEEVEQFMMDKKHRERKNPGTRYKFERQAPSDLLSSPMLKAPYANISPVPKIVPIAWDQNYFY